MTVEQPGSEGPVPAQPVKPLEPHRGNLILTLGILGLAFVFCCSPAGIVLSIIALVLGNNDLRAMQQGKMDSRGEGNTNAGRICGLIGLPLSIIMLILGIIRAAIILPQVLRNMNFS